MPVWGPCGILWHDIAQISARVVGVNEQWAAGCAARRPSGTRPAVGVEFQTSALAKAGCVTVVQLVIMAASPARVAGPRSMPLRWAERCGPAPEPAGGPALSCVENAELEADKTRCWLLRPSDEWRFQSPSFSYELPRALLGRLSVALHQMRDAFNRPLSDTRHFKSPSFSGRRTYSRVPPTLSCCACDTRARRGGGGESSLPARWCGPPAGP